MTSIETWSAEDEQTGCLVSCVYNAETMIYTVIVTRGETTQQYHYPAHFAPKEQMHDKDFEKAKEIAILLADRITANK